MIQIRHLNLGEQMGYRDVNKSSLIVLGCNAGLDRLTDLENKKYEYQLCIKSQY